MPTETVRIASMPDDYMAQIKQFDATDEFLFKAINMGIPMRTGTAIDSGIHDVLVAAGIPFDVDGDGHEFCGATELEAHHMLEDIKVLL